MSEEIKDIFECLKKYANLTTDAIDDLYSLEGTIEDLQQKVEQLENMRKEAIKFILQNCEIIRHEKENVDEVGNVNGADLLNILNKGDNNGK